MDAMELDEEKPITYKGFSHIALISGSSTESHLLGHLLVSNHGKTTSYGISGSEITSQVEKTCSCMADDKWFNFFLTDFTTGKELQTRVLMTGGDQFKLDSDFICFQTESILIDQQAVAHTQKFIKKDLPGDTEVLLAKGTMTVLEISFSSLEAGQKMYYASSETGIAHNHVVIDSNKIT